MQRRSSSPRSKAGELPRPDPIHPTEYKLDQLVMFGDSLTQQSWAPGGTGAALQDFYVRRFDVINRGFSGYNTEWGKHIVSSILPKASAVQSGASSAIRLLTIWFGANDSCLPARPQHVSLAQFKANLRSFVTLIVDPSSAHYSPKTQVVLITPPPIDEAMRRKDQVVKWGEDATKDRSAEVTKTYAEAVIEVAKSFDSKQVIYADVYSALSEAIARSDGKPERFLSDGLHFTAEGYKVVTDTLIGPKGVLLHDGQRLLPDQLPQLFPGWEAIDPKEPQYCFPPYKPAKVKRDGTPWPVDRAD